MLTEHVLRRLSVGKLTSGFVVSFPACFDYYNNFIPPAGRSSGEVMVICHEILSSSSSF